MVKGIVLLDKPEVLDRVLFSPDYLHNDIADPETYVRSLIEKIADETGIVSSVEISPHGKAHLKFSARVDIQKLRRLAAAKGKSGRL